MKLQRTPLILLTIAALLGGFVYFNEVQGASKKEANQTASTPLFQIKESDVQSFTVNTGKQTLSFVKTPVAQLKPSLKQQLEKEKQSKPETPVWVMTAPKESLASDASVAYLLNLIATGKSEQTLKVPAAQQAEFGFNQPLATVEVKLQNQQTHRLILGKPNFNQSALYAQADPAAQPASELTISLVSIDFENAVTRPLADWQAEPKKNSKKTNGS